MKRQERRNLKRPRQRGPGESWLREPTAGTADAEFLSAVMCCMGQLPVRTVLEGIIDRVVSSSSSSSSLPSSSSSPSSSVPSSGGVATCGCCCGPGGGSGDRVGGDSNSNGAVPKKADSAAVSDGVDGEVCGSGDSRLGHDAAVGCANNTAKRCLQRRGGGVGSGKTAAEQELADSTGGQEASTQPLFCRCREIDPVGIQSVGELARGVPWPEWRRSTILTPTSNSISTVGGGKTSPISPLPTNDAAETVVARDGFMEGTPGLWFPACLTARQRAIVHQAARDEGLCHESVGENEWRQVVVWQRPSPTVVCTNPHMRLSAVSSKSQQLPCLSPLARPIMMRVGAAAQGDGGGRPGDGVMDDHRSPEAVIAEKASAEVMVEASMTPTSAIGIVEVQRDANSVQDIIDASEKPDSTAVPRRSFTSRGDGVAAEGDGGDGGDGCRRSGKSAAEVSRELDESTLPILGLEAAEPETPISASNSSPVSFDDILLTVGRPTESGGTVRGEASRVQYAAASHATAEGSAVNRNGGAVDVRAGVAMKNAEGAMPEIRDATQESLEVETVRVVHGPWASTEAASVSGVGNDREECHNNPHTSWSPQPSPTATVQNVDTDDEDGSKGSRSSTSLVSRQNSGLSTAARERKSSRSSGSSAAVGQNKVVKDDNEVLFVVVGAVDGVAEEVVAAPEDADEWETRRVIVEIKNRMGRVRNPPPLYDQIQLVVSTG